MKNTYISLTPNFGHLVISIMTFILIVNVWAFLTNQIADNEYWEWALMIGFPFLLLALFFRFVTIRRRDNEFVFRDILKKEILTDLSEVERWWNYEMKASPEVHFDSPFGKDRRVGDKVYMYARFSSGRKEQMHKGIIIYEQIHFAKDFIDGLDYKRYEEEEGVRYFKVWSLSGCMRKLGVEVGENVSAC